MKKCQWAAATLSALSLMVVTAGFAQGDVGSSAASGTPTRSQLKRVNVQDPFGMTPLDWAVIANQPDQVDLLLSRGANPNIQDDYGMTPLHYAAQQGRRDIVGLLLQRNADPDVQDEDHMTPFQWAAIGAHHDVMDLLLGR